MTLQFNVVNAHCVEAGLARFPARAWVVWGDAGSVLAATRVVTNATFCLTFAMIIAFLNASSI